MDLRGDPFFAVFFAGVAGCSTTLSLPLKKLDDADDDDDCTMIQSPCYLRVVCWTDDDNPMEIPYSSVFEWNDWAKPTAIAYSSRMPQPPLVYSLFYSFKFIRTGARALDGGYDSLDLIYNWTDHRHHSHVYTTHNTRRRPQQLRRTTGNNQTRHNHSQVTGIAKNQNLSFSYILQHKTGEEFHAKQFARLCRSREVILSHTSQ